MLTEQYSLMGETHLTTPDIKHKTQVADLQF